MTTFDLRLDHLGLATTNLERTRQAYERLGFTLTRRSMHEGSTTAGGPVVPWGSGNHCAMFEAGYFELIGLVDESLPSSVKQLVARYEGLHIVALDCASADQTYRQARAAGIPVREPITLERDAPFGPYGDMTRRAGFRNIYLDPAAYPDARYILIEHRTPDVLWQPHLLSHPNGALGLDAVYLVSADAGTVAGLARLLGEPQEAGGMQRFTLPRGHLWVATEEAMRAAAPVFGQAPVHPVAAATIRVKSLSSLAQYFSANQVRYAQGAAPGRGQACIWVGPEEAEHAVLQFVES